MVIMMLKLNVKCEAQINKLNDKVNLLSGYNSNDIIRNLNIMAKNGEVLVGYRACCGTTDSTQKIYRIWEKAINVLRKNGFSIGKERLKIGNAYATISGGFWDEYRYILKDFKEP